MITKPTEAMCDAARGFIMGLDLGIRNWGDMRKHLERSGHPTIPYIIEMAEEGAGGHITKWDVADCIFQLMMTVYEPSSRCDLNKAFPEGWQQVRLKGDEVITESGN